LLRISKAIRTRRMKEISRNIIVVHQLSYRFTR